MDERRFAKTMEQLAGEVGLSRNTLQRYAKMQGCPGKLKKGYPIVDWLEWLKSQNAAKGRLDAQAESAKARKEEAQADFWEIKVEKEQGKYVDKEVMIEQWTTRVAKATALLRAKFENELPAILEGLSPAEIQAQNRAAIDEIIETLAG